MKKLFLLISLFSFAFNVYSATWREMLWASKDAIAAAWCMGGAAECVAANMPQTRSMSKEDDKDMINQGKEWAKVMLREGSDMAAKGAMLTACEACVSAFNGGSMNDWMKNMAVNTALMCMAHRMNMQMDTMPVLRTMANTKTSQVAMLCTLKPLMRQMMESMLNRMPVAAAAK